MKTGTAILQFVNPPLAGWPNLDVRTGVGRKKRFSRIPQKLFCQPQSLFRLLFARQKSRPCAQAHHARKPQTALSTRRVIRILTTHDHQREEKKDVFPSSAHRLQPDSAPPCGHLRKALRRKKMFLAENGKKFGLERFLILLQKGKKQGHNANKSKNTKEKTAATDFSVSHSHPHTVRNAYFLPHQSPFHLSNFQNRKKLRARKWKNPVKNILPLAV